MRLASHAEGYARELAHSDEIGHRVDGSTPAGRCDGFGGIFENVVRVSVRGRPDRVARRAVEWWTGSDAHLDNLLQHDLSHSGVGVWLYHGDAYAVHDLAREKKGSAGVLGWITA